MAATTPTVLIYLNDGTTLAASDYWLADGKLHYYVNYGGENSVDMSQVDLQRTVNENSKRGVRFSLKPNRDSANPAPSSNDYRPRYENKPRTPNTNPKPNSTTSNQNNNQKDSGAGDESGSACLSRNREWRLLLKLRSLIRS